jgi:hypothetical protein
MLLKLHETSGFPPGKKINTIYGSTHSSILIYIAPSLCTWCLCGILLLFSSRIDAQQTCGFGCFGLGGIYAGYGFENFKAGGLNDYIKSVYNYNANSNESPEFNTSKGIRLGANIFRSKHEDFFFTIKGYYHFLKEEKDIYQQINQADRNLKYSFKLNYWGFGVDVGHLLISFIDLKILDAAITFHTSDLSIQSGDDGTTIPQEQYNETKTGIGYSVGSGLIFNLVEDYISLEATAGFNNFSIGQMETQDGKILINPKTNQPVDKFVSSGGFFGIVQLNFGIPLD